MYRSDKPHLDDVVWSSLPQPHLPSDKDLLESYRGAWAIALEKAIRPAHPAVDGGEPYLDATFSENIFQWDSCFITFWARYAQGAIPDVSNVMSCLDNFYGLQKEDGAIAREYSPDGKPIQNIDKKQDTAETPKWARHSAYTNPPLFSWAEWEYYQMTGDSTRLERVYPHLGYYLNWYVENRRRADGLMWTDSFGCGMDNCPRDDAWGWVDYTCQTAFDCENLASIAIELGDHPSAIEISRLYMELKDLVNDKMWNEIENYYCDVDEDGFWTGPLHIGSFWALMADVAPLDRRKAMLKHLQTPRALLRDNMMPSLTASDKRFNPKGGYWRGGVWPPTTYMVVRALDRIKQSDLAHAIALNHARLCAHVYQETNTFWENYAPDIAAPGKPAKPDFCGWSALGPITMLIEYVLGIRVNAVLGEVSWHLRLEREHGIRNLRVGEHTVDMLATKEKGLWRVNLQASGPLSFLIYGSVGSKIVDFSTKGSKEITVS